MKQLACTPREGEEHDLREDASPCHDGFGARREVSAIAARALEHAELDRENLEPGAPGEGGVAELVHDEDRERCHSE